MKDDKDYFFDRPANVKRLMHAFYACCAILVVLDFVIDRYTYHSWENVWAFYPIYGFVGCVVLVVIAKWMRTFLMRDEDYYDRDEQQRIDAATVNSDPLTTGKEHQHVDH